VDDPAGIELAKQVGSIAMPGLVFVGINLDAASREQAVEDMAKVLPGTQLAHRPNLREALLMDSTPLLYVTDRRGTVISVTGHTGPSAAVIDASLR
jgi:hypothetical protein